MMDWSLAIKRNREALERILAALFALVGLAEDGCAMIAYAPSPARLSPRVLSPRGEGVRRPCRLPLLPAGEKVARTKSKPDEGAVEIMCDSPAEGEPRRPHPEGPQDGQDRWLAPKAEGEPRRTLPRRLHAHALRILRAAESAIRRLIVIAARDIAVTLRPGGEGLPPDLATLRKGRREEPAGSDGPDGPAAIRIPAFPLLDPLKRFSFDPPARRGPKSFPRICVVGISEPAPIPQKPVLLPDDPVDAASLCRRLLAARRALANLPREARRLARWQARRKLRQGPGRVLPLRIVGGPPGARKCPVHEVDDVLKECHALAFDALSPPDTS